MGKDKNCLGNKGLWIRLYGKQGTYFPFATLFSSGMNILLPCFKGRQFHQVPKDHGSFALEGTGSWDHMEKVGGEKGTYWNEVLISWTSNPLPVFLVSPWIRYPSLGII